MTLTDIQEMHKTELENSGGQYSQDNLEELEIMQTWE